MNDTINRDEQVAFQHRNLQNRLNYLFNNIISVKTKKQNDEGEYQPTQHEKVFIYTSMEDRGLFAMDSTSLVFKTDFKANCHEHLSSDILVRLFLDTKNRLSLVMWPREDRWPANGQTLAHREVLLENVQSLKFEFYVTKDIITALKEKHPELLENTWIPYWKQEFLVIPTIVKMTITLKNDQVLHLYFPLIDPYKIVEYPK